MLLCTICNEEIFENDEIKCTKCNLFLHFGCAGQREANFRKMSQKVLENWSCLKCKNIIARNEISIATNSPKNIDCFTGSNKLLQDLTDSVKFMSDKFDDFSNQIQDLVTAVKDLKDENKKIKEQNLKLENELHILNKRINILEQEQLGNHVEIIGVPIQENENCGKIIESITSALGVQLPTVNAYRVRSKTANNKSGKIVAELKSKEDKAILIDLVKKKRLSAKNLNGNWDNNGIYINNYLTQSNRNLFYKTRMFAKEHSYKFVWFKNNKLFIKKSENSNTIYIDHENTLDKIKS